MFRSNSRLHWSALFAGLPSSALRSDIYISNLRELYFVNMDVQTGQPGLQAEVFGTIAFHSGDGLEIRATPLHVGRHEVSFELVNLDATLRSSEVLTEFSVKLGGRVAYQGRATITSVTSSGNRTVCSAALEGGWLEVGLGMLSGRELTGAFDGFLGFWQKQCRVRPEFKVVVADLQSLLVDLELWLAQVELGIDTRAEPDLNKLRVGWARDLAGRTLPTLNALFEKFESTAAEAGLDAHPAHRVFARRQLHPWLLCAPFLHRTFRKPLGYAGDYEMVNMISRDPHEGDTLFAKLINHWFLMQPTPEAHRNRLKHLEQRISEAAVTAAREGRRARVLTLGCGPAIEIQEFLRRHAWADWVEFTLIDFNQETLDRTEGCLTQICRQHRRSTRTEFMRKSVMSILRESQGPNEVISRPFDFVYCAGLFDYLTEPVCRRVSTRLFDWLRPGGLFLTTNVHACNPWPFLMDFIADWHLIHRTTREMLATRPEQLAPEDCRLTTDVTGVNIFLEANRPEFR